VKIVVFVGPSVDLDAARRVLPDAIYLPPARQSDLLSAVTLHRPDAIALIDGTFGQHLSVWHKEILHALDTGVRVYGASSMGVLRALETEAFGMIGFGEVFRMYRDGEIEDDDEVAVAHGEAHEGYRPVSEPMVNVRATLRRALDDGAIGAELHDRAVAVAKEIFFPLRTIERIAAALVEAGVARDDADRVAAVLRERYVDVKRDDALALLALLASIERPERTEPTFTMVRSHLFNALYARDRQTQRDDVRLPFSSISQYAAVHLGDFHDLNFRALNRVLVEILAEVLEVEAERAEIDDEIVRFQARRGLDGAALAGWIERNDLTAAEFDELMRSLARCRKLQRWLITRKFYERTTRIVLDELRLAGRYEQVANEATDVERVLGQIYPDFHQVQLEEQDTDMRSLVEEQMRETPWRYDTRLDHWLEEAGFKDVIDLQFELVRARLKRKAIRTMLGDLFAGEAETAAT
jgi:hypothetical protein